MTWVLQFDPRINPPEDDLLIGIAKKALGAIGGPYIALGAVLVILVGVLAAWGAGTVAAKKDLAVAAKRLEAQAKLTGQVVHWGDVVCALVSVPFRPQGASPDHWGDLCLNAIAEKARFHSQTLQTTNDTLVKNLNAQLAARDADLKAAKRDAAATRAAIQKLTEASAHVQNDQAGPDYWAALNDAGGLRPPQSASRP